MSPTFKTSNSGKIFCTFSLSKFLFCQRKLFLVLLLKYVMHCYLTLVYFLNELLLLNNNLLVVKLRINHMTCTVQDIYSYTRHVNNMTCTYTTCCCTQYFRWVIYLRNSKFSTSFTTLYSKTILRAGSRQNIISYLYFRSLFCFFAHFSSLYNIVFVS